MKLTYEKMINIRSVLVSLKLGEYTKESGKLIRLWSLIAKELEEYDVIRIGLCEKSGKIDKETNSYVFSSDKVQKQFAKEHDALLATEIEISPSFTNIDVSKIKNIGTDEVGLLYTLLDDVIVL